MSDLPVRARQRAAFESGVASLRTVDLLEELADALEAAEAKS